ncbi:GILT-like protein F37H8.5 isoform X1 [Citrus clementina]|uniref:GILT-like protein F37H8.5 isoform X1 n=1 Tax=Citrus clementina TaxID=85681 RepID=UPI000CED5247|nr:GILT-like protein F37H8.5 isoform X1 [Citrus x clementina]
MASTKLLTFFFPASLLLLSISPFGSSENVTVSVYYETLCPYCADFIVNHLVKLFQKGLNSIVNLRMIPWGNSMMQPDGTFVCQHGPGECLLNTIEACTISIYPDVVQHFSFIHCVERLALEKRQAEWINCFELTKLGRVPIDCYRNGLGKLLEQKYATETAQLKPPHRFVPWVVVNNQPLQRTS